MCKFWVMLLKESSVLSSFILPFRFSLARMNITLDHVMAEISLVW